MEEHLLAKPYRENEKYSRAVEDGMRLGLAINGMRDQLRSRWDRLARIRAFISRINAFAARVRARHA